MPALIANPNLGLALQFDGQYDPAVGAELQQLTAAIQQWANGQSGQGVWQDIDPTQCQYSSNTGAWAAKATWMKWNRIGTRLEVQFYIPFAACPASSAVYVSLPLPFTVRGVAQGSPSGYLHGTLSNGLGSNKCILILDLDDYRDAIVTMTVDKGPVTLRVVPNAAGSIITVGAGIVGTVCCEVMPQV